MAEKRKRVVLGFNQKLEIIKRLKKGETPTNIAQIYGVGRTTVNDIKRDAEKIEQHVSQMQSNDGDVRKSPCGCKRKLSFDNITEDHSEDSKLNTELPVNISNHMLPDEKIQNITMIISPKPISKKIKLFPRYINDLSVENFKTPRRTNLNLSFVKNRYNEKLKKNLISENASTLIQPMGSESLCEIIERKLNGKKLAFSNELKKFAITLQYYSSKAYNFVRIQFSNVLPHPRILNKCSRNKTVIGNLVLDEMSIKDKVEFNGKAFHGLVDMGSGTDLDGDNINHTTSALVFLIVAVNGNWKLPLGYFLVKGLNSSELVNLVKKCLELIHDTGVIVNSMTFDGAHTNLSKCTKLGANLNINNPQFFFPHPVTKELVFLFYDPCHMIKLIRNTLGNKKVLIGENNKEIKWDHIKNLYYKEKHEVLKAAKKFTRKHIYYYNEKMNVKLASQVLSSNLNSEFTNVKSTAEFCMIMNNAFVILNSLSTFDKYLDFTNKFEKYVHSLMLSGGQKVVDLLRKTGFVGIVWGLKNLMNYYTFKNNKKYDIEYILFCKLSQDHLETFFSSIRSRGGYNKNPSCKEFKMSYKKLLVHHHVSDSHYGNCLPESMLKNTTISELDSRRLDNDECNDNLESTQSYDHDHNYIETYLKLSPFIAGMTDYISGFIERNVAKKINCDVCKTFLIDKSNNSLLIKLKYKNNALVKPSEDVSYICKVIEIKIKFKDLN
ncbi:hypothetical protein QTP88_000552 [Uroleucon formosanum]